MGLVGWKAGFQENIWVSAGSFHQFSPHIGHLDYEEVLMQATPCYLSHDTCPTREFCLNFLQTIVTQEPLCWHFYLSIISSKQWLARFIFLPAATENVFHLMDGSCKVDMYMPNKTLEIISLWWCSIPWHMILFLTYWSESEWVVLVSEHLENQIPSIFTADSKYIRCLVKA